MTLPVSELRATSPEQVSPSPKPDVTPTRVARNAAYLFVGQVMTTVLGVVVNALLGRSLGAADFGLLYLVTSSAALPYVLLEWGQTSYVVAEVASRRSEAGALVASSLALRIAGVPVASGLTALAMYLLGYDVRTRMLASILVVAMLPLFLAQACSMAFRGYERMDYDASTSVLAKIFAALVILPTLALGGRVLSVIVAQGVAGVGTLVVALVLLRGLRIPPLRPSLVTTRELVVGGAPLVVFSLGVTVQQYVDSVLISKLAPATVVGWYGAARTFGGVLIAPIMVLSSSLYPRLAFLLARDPERFRKEARAAVRPLLTIGMLLAVGTYLFADVAISLVYSKRAFAESAAVLQAIAPSILLLTIGIFVATVANASRKRKQLAFAKVTSIVAGVIMAFLLVPWAQERYGNGGIGAALVSSGVELVMVLLSVPLLPRGLLDRTVGLDIGRALVVGAGTLLVGRSLVAVSPWLRLPVVLLAFVALSIPVRLLRPRDVALLGQMLPRRGRAG
jgi:O-antigen/teichoic acid export membrane protein